MVVFRPENSSLRSRQLFPRSRWSRNRSRQIMFGVGVGKFFADSATLDLNNLKSLCSLQKNEFLYKGYGIRCQKKLKRRGRVRDVKSKPDPNFLNLRAKYLYKNFGSRVYRGAEELFQRKRVIISLQRPYLITHFSWIWIYNDLESTSRDQSVI